MPGTNQSGYQGRIVEVQAPSGGPWRSFLWNPQNWINADQINEPGVYDGLNERIRRPQSGDKSYLDMARECFHQIHGLDDDEKEDTAFTKEHVEEALNRTYVGDQTYRERFGIGNITEDNLRLLYPRNHGLWKSPLS